MPLKSRAERQIQMQNIILTFERNFVNSIGQLPYNYGSVSSFLPISKDTIRKKNIPLNVIQRPPIHQCIHKLQAIWRSLNAQSAGDHVCKHGFRSTIYKAENVRSQIFIELYHVWIIISHSFHLYNNIEARRFSSVFSCFWPIKMCTK